jgi:hypothetical protein
MSDQGAEPPKYPGEGTPEGVPLPSPVESLAASVTKPTSIAIAVRLMWAGAALEVVARVVGLATGLYDGYQPVAQVAIGAVVTSCLWAWMARANGEGQSSARGVATLFGGIGIIRALSCFFVIGAFGGGVVGFVSSMILLVLAVAILVLLWTKESTDYYQRRGPETGSALA